MTPLQELQHTLKVTVTKEDYASLTPHLTGWMKLNEVLVAGVSLDQAKKLLVVEVGNKGRKHIIDKLVGRIKSLESRALRQQIDFILRA